MALTFPDVVNTPADRTEYAYRSQELLRLLHNEMGKKFRDGVISKREWNSFLTETFQPASNKISDAIGEEREKLKRSSRWAIDILGI